MTLRHGLTKGEKFETLEKRVETLEKAVRISQMLLQQMGGSMPSISRDIGDLAQRQREIQYKLLAMQSLLTVDSAALVAKAEELQVKDFDDMSAKEDAQKGYSVADVVSEDSIVILTSKVPTAPDSAILRSKLMMSEIGFPQLKQDLLGKKPGDTLVADINGAQHQLTVLGVRSMPAKLELVPDVKE